MIPLETGQDKAGFSGMSRLVPSHSLQKSQAKACPVLFRLTFRLHNHLLCSCPILLKSLENTNLPVELNDEQDWQQYSIDTQFAERDDYNTHTHKRFPKRWMIHT